MSFGGLYVGLIGTVLTAGALIHSYLPLITIDEKKGITDKLYKIELICGVIAVIIIISGIFYLVYLRIVANQNKQVLKETKDLKDQDFYKQKEKIDSLQDKIKLLNKKTQKPDFKDIEYLRFEQIKAQNKFVFGHIDYEPFFKMRARDGINAQPTGIGYAILKEIFSVFNVKIKEYKHSGNWENIFENLTKKGKNNKYPYDIIVTPLYETRSRIYKYPITYCIPIFYSEIGLFVHDNDFDEKKSLKQIKKDISDNSNKWKSPFIKGEVSEIIATKLKTYVGDDSEAEVPDDSQGHLNLLDKVNDRDTIFKIVAMEVFKANAIIDNYNKRLNVNDKNYKKEKLNLKNILKEKQLLYPVSFIVRKEDTVLRNFINLRIAELYERTPLPRDKGLLIEKFGTKSLIDIIKEEAWEVDKIHPNKTGDMFIQTYDFTNLV